MNAIEEYRNKLFTEKGLEALDARLQTLVTLYGNISYPYYARMLGFPPLSIPSREIHAGMIHELSQVLGEQIQVHDEQ